ncbi:MAG: beta-galactosidase [Phycisphaerales bacterium]
MPTVSDNGQAFQIDGRRTWIVGASVQYARIPRAEWDARIADVVQAGFNTIETAVPWMVHEPRPGRFRFDGDGDVADFVERCGNAGLHVILRVGPYVGEGFDGGGLPGWLQEDPGMVTRCRNEAFLSRVSKWFHALFEHVAPMQVTQEDGGPILLVQVEHDWHCGNEVEAARYFGELVRMVHESGVDVPIINANALWTDSYGTIDAWQGRTDLLANLRQLRVVRPNVPRLVSRYDAAPSATWEGGVPTGPDGQLSPEQLMHGMATILAAGGQPVIAPFHAGTNLGALAGRLPGPDGGMVCHTSAAGAPLGECGERGRRYLLLRRLALFASNFGHVFGDLDPEAQAPIQDPPAPMTAAEADAAGGSPTITVVPLTGSAGRILMVFADRPGATTTLLLADGRRLPVDLGDQCVGWYAVDVDLGGRARLDYANACPLMLVDRSILVLCGAAGSTVYMSLADTPIEVTVPTGPMPEVVEHHGITVVVVSQAVADTTVAGDGAVYVGVSGLTPDGEPRARLTGGDGWRIDPGGEMVTIKPAEMAPAVAAGPGATTNGVAGGGTAKKKTTRKKTAGKSAGTSAGKSAGKSAGTTKANEPHAPTTLPIPADAWEFASAAPRVHGHSPRFARIKGPATLEACGASSGVGWYRATWRSGSTRKRTLLALGAGHRVRFWLNGKPAGVFGTGPDAVRQPIDMPVQRGDQMLTALAQTFGRPASGNDLDRSAGLHGHLVEIKKVPTGRAKVIEADPADAFALRGFVAGVTPEIGSTRHYQWTFSHAKKTPLILHVADAPTPGIFLINGTPVGLHAGVSGIGWTTLSIDPAAEWFKRGKNELRFNPLESDAGDGSDVAKAVTLYEIADELTTKADWAFERWARPADADFAPRDPQARSKTAAGEPGEPGVPGWWRCRFEAPAGHGSVRIDLSGMSAGAAFLNGRDLGRFIVGGEDGPLPGGGPQTRLRLPRAWMTPTGNDLAIFDELGRPPLTSQFHLNAPGELEALPEA